MKIALAMIIKDDSELGILERCLNSIQNYVDDVYLTVTRPNQPEIAKFAKKRNIKLSEFKWDYDEKDAWKNWDFSKARNFNFSQVKNADWIMWLDTDDIFVGGEHLREIAQSSLEAGKDVVFFSYWYGCTFDGEPSIASLKTVDLEHLRERLLKPGKTVWKGQLHETPVPLEGIRPVPTYVKYTQDQPLAVMHATTDKMSMDRVNRNRQILEKQLISEGSNPDPRTLLYLMKIYAEEKDPVLNDKCLEYGKLYVQKSGWDEERGVAYEIMGNIYGKRGEHALASEMYMNGIREWPHQPMTYLRLAQSFFNMKRYRDCKHWMDIGMKIEITGGTTSMVNYEAMKILSSELLLKLAFQVDKDTKKALEAAKLLQSVHPTDEHQANVDYLESVDRLNDACANADKLCTYLQDVGMDKVALQLLNTLPPAIVTQPFAVKLRHQLTGPKVWAKNEIAYFASFGSPHFEKWDGNSLAKGIGGSETAVIRLSEEWVKKGYKVTVYCDPVEACEVNGVSYVPYYWMNKEDKFNVFIQWRGWGLAKMIKARKFLVDLHDIFAGIDIAPKDVKLVDKFMVKSLYHRNLAPQIPDKKFLVVSNGI